MKLDEKIKYFDDLALTQYELGIKYEEETENYAICMSFANEAHQLATWLKELKQWREAKVVQTATENTETLIFNDEIIGMREPTEKERRSTTEYIDSISQPPGIYISENATNGDVVKQLYPFDTEVYTNGNLIGYRTITGFIVWYELDWWNEPFKGVRK